MPLAPAPPPDDVLDHAAAFVEATPHMLFARSAKGDRLPAEAELVAPHRVFTIPGDSRRRFDLSEAVFAGWRFLVEVSGTVMASVETSPEATEVPVLNSGPYVRATAQLIRRLTVAGAPEDHDYEFRLLKLCPVHLWSAWLSGERQMLVPLRPVPGVLRGDKTYSEAAFAELLGDRRGAGIDP